MNENELIPEHVFERYKTYFDMEQKPNIVKSKNITKDGVDVLINKNNLLWTFSTYEDDYIYFEGIIHWGSNKVFIYFKKLESENTYKLYVINDNLDSIKLLLVGLNKFFTIDKI